MLGRLSSRRPTLRCDVLVHARDLPFDLGNRLGQLGDLLPERPTLLDAQEQIRPAQARIGHHRNPVPSNPRWVPTAAVLPLSATAERLPLPPAKRSALLVLAVPLSCHIGRSTTVSRGQPRYRAVNHGH
jgi:hypothetical protein